MSTLRFESEEAFGPKRFFAKLKREQLAHAYLFSGPAGVGKKHFARLLTQSLLCEAPKPEGVLGYDGSCHSCRLFLAGTHPDFYAHEGELKIGERESGRAGEELTARDLVRVLSLHAYGSSCRVLLLGDLEFATHHAANALLKFFEEPPAGVVLLLTSSAPGKLLGTIRSRLVEVPFPALSTAAVGRILAAQGVDAADAARVSAAAQGSVTRARELVEEHGLREQVVTWFFAALAGQSADAAWATRATLASGLELIGLLIRDWAVQCLGKTAGFLSGEDQRFAALPQESKSALLALEAFHEAQRLGRTNVSPGLVLEGLRLALAQLALSARPRHVARVGRS